MTSTILSVVLGLLTLVSVVASAVAVARASLAKSTIDTLKESNGALVEQARIQGSELERVTTRLTALEGENKMLRTLASGSEAVDRMAAGLTVADNERKGEHHDILAAVHAQQVVYAALHDEAMALIRASVHTHNEAA